MTAEDVVVVLDLLEATLARAALGAGRSPRLVVCGGWGIDALWGDQTRDHADLDLLVSAEHEAAVLDALAARGYVVAVDWRPVRVAVVDPDGREVDVHPTEFDAEGNGVQASLTRVASASVGSATEAPFTYPAADIVEGRIGGRVVACLSAVKQSALHDGYPLRDVDRHDLGVLAGLAQRRLGG